MYYKYILIVGFSITFFNIYYINIKKEKLIYFSCRGISYLKSKNITLQNIELNDNEYMYMMGFESVHK